METQIRQTESALVCAARDGHKEALRELLDRNWNWLKGLVYNVLGNPTDVEDVLQNICVLLIRKINTIREPERFRPWLAKLARNEALAWREKMSQRPRPLDEAIAVQISDERALDLFEEADQKEMNERIIKAIQWLPDKYREVFMLKYSQDLSYAEIAEILDIPVTTVQIRLVRARRMIYNKVTGRPSDKVPRT